ncbi:hypothetical protein BH18ACT1_BH18ACT1_04380 [soil metagenome]
MTPTADLGAARRFLLAEGRVLERRLLACSFDGASPDGALAALMAHANPDGGFGHGLEPDTRGPDSQPLDVQVALEVVGAIGGDPAVATRACDFLATVGPDGAVPILLPSALAHPRASHWHGIERWDPDLNPTAAIAGLLHRLGVAHAWRDSATAWCFARLEADGPPGEAHALACVLPFLDHAPDRARAAPLARAAGEALPARTLFRSDPDDPGYGLAPHHFAPSPASPWRRLFDDASFDAHLDRLVRDQQPDGGWPITWEPPSATAVLDWRGIVTLRAMEVLRAYGRA